MEQEPQQEEFPDPRADPRIQELEQRMARAQSGFDKLNRGRRESDPYYKVDGNVIMMARLDALASVLVAAGLINYVEFTGEHLIRECEVLEAALVAATELKRQQSGLIVPPHRNGNG